MRGLGYRRRIETFVAVYPAIGFLIAFGLFGWAAVSTVRREGSGAAVGNALRTYIEELPFYWRVVRTLETSGRPAGASWTARRLPLVDDLAVLGRRVSSDRPRFTRSRKRRGRESLTRTPYGRVLGAI
jgi:hypothetical protein